MIIEITLEVVGEYSLYVFLVSFCCASFISIACAMRLFLITKPGWTITKIVHCLIPICLLARTNDLTVNFLERDYKMFFRPAEHQGVWDMFFASLPVYMFFTTYILVCLSWYYVFQKSFSRSPLHLSHIMKFYLAINVFVYTFYVTFVVLMSFHKLRKTTHIVETTFACTISILAGLGFALFGSKLYFRMRHLTVEQINKLTLKRKIGYIAIMCTFVFFLRACMIMISFFFFSKPYMLLINNIVWYIVIELVPSMAVLVLMGGNPLNKVVSPSETQPFIS